MCLEDCGNRRARRDFLKSAGAALGGVALGPVPGARALPPHGSGGPVRQGTVEFESGGERVEGYLALPATGAGAGARAVLVLHGNAGLPEDVRHTAARLAAAGFVGLAVSSTSRERDDAAKLPREFVMSDRFIRRYVADGRAGVEYLKKERLCGVDAFGLLGYCGGGYTAARLAVVEPRVRAVVALYAAPEFPPARRSATDPRPDMLDFIGRVDAPVQFHYGTRDSMIPNESVARLRERLKGGNRRPEIYVYEGAGHGFANMTGEAYRADYAALAERRWRKFLRKHL